MTRWAVPKPVVARDRKALDLNHRLSRRTMLKTIVALVLLTTPAAFAAQPIWKCQEGGRTSFSDVPCPTTGATVEPPPSHTNVMQPEHVPVSRAVGKGAARSGVAAPRHCLSDQDLRNLETKAGSFTVHKPEREFLHDEIRRARLCQRGQGSYTRQDLRDLLEAQEAQGVGSQHDRALARAKAAAIHRAAGQGGRTGAAARRDRRHSPG
jgi:hypothetical protein